MEFRRALFRAHRWLTLAFGPFVCVMTVSGALLVFRDGINRLLYRELYRETPGATAIESGYQTVAGRYPDWVVLAVALPPAMSGVYEFQLAPEDVESERSLYVYVDGGSGRLLGERDPDSGFVAWLSELHAELFLGDFGRLLVGALGVVLLVIVATGVYLWWPRLTSWTSKWCLRRRWGRLLFHYDLHQLVGILATPGLVVIVITGVAFAFPEQARALWYGLTRTERAPNLLLDDPPTVEPTDTPRMTWDEVASRAAARAPWASPVKLSLPEEEEEAVLVWLSGPRDAYRGRAGSAGNVFIYVDPYRGEILDRQGPGDVPVAANFFENWLFPLHMGSYGGLPVRLAYGLVGVAPIALTVTGVTLWWLRRRRRPTAGESEVPSAARGRFRADVEPVGQFRA